MVCHGTDFLGLSPGTVSAGHKEKIIREERKNNSMGKLMSRMGKHNNLEDSKRKYAKRGLSAYTGNISLWYIYPIDTQYLHYPLLILDYEGRLLLLVF